MSQQSLWLDMIVPQLDAMNVRYYLKLHDGTVFKNIELPPREPRVPQPRASRVREHVQPYISNLQPGEAVDIPCPAKGEVINAGNVQTRARGDLMKKYGQDCFVTTRWFPSAPGSNEGYVTCSLAMRKTEARHGN